MQNISRLIENIDRMDSICRGKSNRFRPVAVNVMSHKANLVFFLNRAFNKHLCQESRVSKCRYHWLTNNSLGSLFTWTPVGWADIHQITWIPIILYALVFALCWLFAGVGALMRRWSRRAAPESDR